MSFADISATLARELAEARADYAERLFRAHVYWLLCALACVAIGYVWGRLA